MPPLGEENPPFPTLRLTLRYSQMSKKVGAAIQNSILLSLGAFAATGLNFLLVFVYARLLGPTGLGSLNTSLMQVGVWALLVDLGLSNGLISSLTDGRGHLSPRALLRRVLIVRMLGATLATALVVGFSLLQVREGADAPQFLQDLAFLPFLYALALQQTAVAYASYLGQQKLVVSSVFWAGLLTVGLCVLLAFLHQPIPWLLFVQSLSGFVAAALIFLRLPRPSADGVAPSWHLLFAASWSHAVVFAVSTLWSRLDQIAASRLLGLETGGNYALAVRLVSIPILGAAAVTIATFPDMQRVGRDDPGKVGLYLGASAKWLLRYGLFLAIAGLWLVGAILGPLLPKFAEAVKILPWFAPGVWAYWLHSLQSNALFGLKKDREVVVAHVVAIVVYLLTLVPLTWLFSIYGVVWSFNLFSLVLGAGTFFYLKKSGALAPGFSLLGAYSPEEREIGRKIKNKILRRGD